MKKLFIILVFFCSSVKAESHLQFFIESALKNNLELNAERKKHKSIKQNLNIARSEFLPSVSLSGEQSSSQSTNKTDHSGSNLSDSNLDSEKKLSQSIRKFFKVLKE